VFRRARSRSRSCHRSSGSARRSIAALTSFGFRPVADEVAAAEDAIDPEPLDPRGASRSAPGGFPWMSVITATVSTFGAHLAVHHPRGPRAIAIG